MKMTNNAKRIILTAVIILVVFSVVVFAVPFPKGGIFWLSYIFSVLSVEQFNPLC